MKLMTAAQYRAAVIFSCLILFFKEKTKKYLQVYNMPVIMILVLLFELFKQDFT